MGFVIYAVLLGIASAMQNMVQYLSFRSDENLCFVIGTRFFKSLLNIRLLARDVTVIAITHRGSYIANTDSVIDLNPQRMQAGQRPSPRSRQRDDRWQLTS